MIGRSSVRIFLFFKRGSKISKINNCFATQAARMLEKNLLANGNKHYTQVQKNEWLPSIKNQSARKSLVKALKQNKVP